MKEELIDCPICGGKVTLCAVGDGFERDDTFCWEVVHVSKKSACKNSVRSDYFPDFCKKDDRLKYKKQIISRWNNQNKEK